MGLIYAAALATGTSGVAPQDAGIASACISAGQQLGGASGIALLNTIASTAAVDWLNSHLHGRPAPDLIRLAAVHSYITVFWWCAALFAVGAVVSGLLLRRGPLPGASAGSSSDRDHDIARVVQGSPANSAPAPHGSRWPGR